jgi:ATP-dependent Clp protease protease subunit
LKISLLLASLILVFSNLAFAKELVLTSENTVTLRGPVTSSSVGEVMHELSAVSQQGEASDPIYLVLNTPGGSVMAGVDLMNYVNTLRRPVHAVAVFAASMGFHILQNSPIRFVTELGTIMSHRANGATGGDIPQQVDSRLNYIKSLLEKMDEKVISRTSGKHTKESYTELIRDEYWAVGSNAIKDGFADEAVSLKCDESLNGTIDRQVQILFFVVNIKLSKCPLITQPLVENAKDYFEVINYLNQKRTMEF